MHTRIHVQIYNVKLAKFTTHWSAEAKRMHFLIRPDVVTLLHNVSFSFTFTLPMSCMSLGKHAALITKHRHGCCLTILHIFWTRYSRMYMYLFTRMVPVGGQEQVKWNISDTAVEFITVILAIIKAVTSPEVRHTDVVIAAELTRATLCWRSNKQNT